MKDYTITHPSLYGIISDDSLYFEGLKKPNEFYEFRDEIIEQKRDVVILRDYFNDMHSLFLRKLEDFCGGVSVGDESSIKLQALLQEIIKVKKLIENAENEDIMKE